MSQPCTCVINAWCAHKTGLRNYLQHRKGIERVALILNFFLRGVEVRVEGVRQDVPPKMESITYEIIVDSDESDHRLELLHENVKKYGTLFNTITPCTSLSGILQRKFIP